MQNCVQKLLKIFNIHIESSKGHHYSIMAIIPNIDQYATLST